jgi:hypothetical protein
MYQQQQYQQNYDPTYNSLSNKIAECNYGPYQHNVVQSAYTFMKQYTNFTAGSAPMTYSNGTTANVLTLTGGVTMTYMEKKYTIPIEMHLPYGFPTSAPKVLLNFTLDEASAKSNPLIINGNQVMNNYLHKWNSNTQQYNLGGLCYNLSKSFDIHPPLGSAPKVEKKGIFSTAASMTSGMVNTVKEKVTGAMTPSPKTDSVDSGATCPSNLEDEKHQKQVEEAKSKISTKLAMFDRLFEDGQDEFDPDDNYLIQAKQEMEEKSRKMKQEILVIEGDKEEMKSRYAPSRFLDRLISLNLI